MYNMKMEEDREIAPSKDGFHHSDINLVTPQSIIDYGKNRSYSETVADGVLFRFESEESCCKPCSPIAPATTPSPLEMSFPSTQNGNVDTNIYWKDVLTQINTTAKTMGTKVRPEINVKMAQQKYFRYASQQTSPAAVPSLVKPAQSYTSRPRYLRPLEPKKRKPTTQKNRKMVDTKEKLDISGNALFCHLADRQTQSRDYIPGCVKTKHHYCYRCVNRMSLYDQHSWMDAFHLACRARRNSLVKSVAAGEPLLCIKGSKEYYYTKTRSPDTKDMTSNVTMGSLVEMVQSEVTPRSPRETSNKKDINMRISKTGSRSRGHVLRCGRFSENIPCLPNHQQLTSIMITIPIDRSIIKSLEMRSRRNTNRLHKAKSLMLAIECKKRDKGSQQYGETEDDMVSSGFTMITQGECLSPISRENNSVLSRENDLLRSFTFSVMEDANTVYRPESILSVGDTSDVLQKLPIIVFSDSDLTLDALNTDVKDLNKNTSAKESKQPSYSSCYWIATNEAANHTGGYQELQAYAKPPPRWPSTDKVDSSTRSPRQSEFPLFPEEEDPDFEEDDDEDGEADNFYQWKTIEPKFKENFTLPTGKMLCYTAMTDKRYNKWSKQKRKMKKKMKKRIVEEKSTTSNESTSAHHDSQLLKSLEALYRNHDGILKYKHDKPREILKTSTITISTPEIVKTTNDGDTHINSKTSDVSSISSERILTDSTPCAAPDCSRVTVHDNQAKPHEDRSTPCSIRPKEDCGNDFEDGDDGEVKHMYSNNNSDECKVKGEIGQSKSTCKQELPTYDADKSSSKLEITGRRSFSGSEECSEMILPVLTHPYVLSSRDRAQRAATSQAYISRMQKQIHWIRKDLLYSNSILCPLSVNVSSKDYGTVSSKFIRNNGMRRTSPRPIPRNYTAMRNTTDSFISVVQGKKTATTKKSKSKNIKRRPLRAEDIESITIQDLLSNLSADQEEFCNKKKTTSRKSTVHGLSFRDIYGKSPYCRGSNSTGIHHKNQEQEKNISSLVFSRSVMFSVQPLPDVYKSEHRQ